MAEVGANDQYIDRMRRDLGLPAEYEEQVQATEYVDLWEKYHTPDWRCGSIAPISLQRCCLEDGHSGSHTADHIGGWNRSRFDYAQVEDRESDEAAGILEGAVDLSSYDTGE